MADASNILSGHTTANYNTAYSANQGRGVDGLKDGDQILSASLTNMLEGVHDNGILLLDDTAIGGGNRLNPDNLSGAVSKGASAHQISIKGGYVVLDGALYAFANGYNGANPNTFTINLTDNKPGTTTDNESKVGNVATVESDEECLFTVYLSSETDSDVEHIYWEQSDVIPVAAGTYPSSPSVYLKSPSANSVKQTVVIATIRAIHNGSAHNDNDLEITITEINDKRIFLRPTPMYLSPVTKGAVGSYTSANSVNSATDLQSLHAGQTGDLNASPFGAIWMSHSTDKITAGGTRLGAIGDDVLFLSYKEGGSRKTMRFGPEKVHVDDSLSTTTNYFTFDGPNIFVLQPQQGSTLLNPDNSSTDFPIGHLVMVRNENNSGGHAIAFDSTGLNHSVPAQENAIFVKTASAWRKVFTSSASSTGAVTAVNNATENELVTIGNTVTELEAEALLKFDGVTLEVGASGNGADLLLHSATANNVGMKWDHDDQTNGSLILGADNYGVDFKAFGDTASKFIHWDASVDTLYVQSILDVDGTITVGVDGTGYDVKFFGDTASAYMLWDQSQDDLILGGAARLGIGDTTPGTQLQITADGPTITLKNSIDENTEGGAESNILFEDHTNASLASIQGSHHGAASDTKGKLILSTHTGSTLTTALTIDSSQVSTFAGDVTITGDLTINGASSSISVETLNVDQPLIEIGLSDGAAPSADAVKDLGLKMHWHTGSAAKIAALVLDESTSASVPSLTYIPDATDSSGLMSGAVGTMVANLSGNLSGDQSGGSISATTITGSADVVINTDDFVVNTDTTNPAKVGINQATPLVSLQVGGSGYEHKSVAGGTSNNTTTVSICTPAQFRSIEVLVSSKATDDSAFEATKVLVIHDSTNGSTGNTAITTYGTINDGDTVATYGASISGGNVNLTISYLQIGGGNKTFATEIAWIGLKI
jgi:hypothetical protein